ncbi:MAG TPA: hypothetical protein VJ141_05265 [Candidatus Limnocylindrales bacterium]|nr:hypothetical protein [Candidatus Limnocylindrales bacterium]
MGAADTARLLASLELQDKGFTKGIQSATGSLGKLETSMGRIGGIASRGVQTAGQNIARLGAIAAGVIATQVYAGIRSLEELERVTNATEGVIKSTGSAAGVTAKQVRDLAQSLEGITTADDKVIQSGENLLLTFTNIGKEVFPQATKAMVDLGIAMAQGDVESADFKSSAIQLGKALNDPIKGITALTRVGVSFTEEQKKQIKTLVESGKTMEAQKIILAELEREFGEAGKAAGKGFGADIRRVKDAIEDAQQALATGFLPLIRKVADVLSRELAKPETIAAIKSFGESLAGGLDRLIGVAQRLPWSQIGDSLKLAGQGAKAVFDAFTALPPWIQTAVLTGWGLNKLTGGAVIDITAELGKGVFGKFLARGSPANPMFVVPVGGGLGGAAPTVVGAGGGLLGKVLKVAIVGAVVVEGLQLWMDSFKPFLEENQTLADQGLTAAEIAAVKYYQSDSATQQAALKHLGQAPSKADFDSGMEKLKGTIKDSGPARPDLTGWQTVGKTLAAAFGTHEAATGAFGSAELQRFRGGDISLLDERIRYLSGAQGSGAGSAGFLALVGRDIAALKTALPNASAADAAKITAAIDLLGGILEAKKFEPSQALIDAVTGKPSENSEASRAQNAMATLPGAVERTTAAIERLRNQRQAALNVTVNIETAISVSALARKTTIVSRYGSVGGPEL